MSATEDDTELTDLLIQNLENNGVLNKLKAEMRAAVFLAMEEQDKLENKTPLVNENLRRCLSTKEGRLAASLIVDFLQVFNLDFTLAVFQPEINSMNGLDSRELLCRQMSLSPSELNQNSPLLLELVRGECHKPAEGGRSLSILKDSASAGNDGLQQQISRLGEASERGNSSSSQKMEALDLDDHEDGDSFFDDPLPKPQKTYGMKVEASQARGDPTGSFSLGQRPGGGGGEGGGGGSLSEQSHIRNDDDVEYDDDFNSHRSDLSRSELSVGEDIEEVSIEGPEISDKIDDITQDLSVSQLSQSHGADYMEEVA